MGLKRLRLATLSVRCWAFFAEISSPQFIPSTCQLQLGAEPRISHRRRVPHRVMYSRWNASFFLSNIVFLRRASWAQRLVTYISERSCVTTLGLVAPFTLALHPGAVGQPVVQLADHRRASIKVSTL